MRGINTLIIVGFISFAGFTVHAQSTADVESVFQSLGSSSSLTDIVGGIVDTSAPTGEQVSTIDVPLVVDVDVPEVNKTTAPAYTGGALTGRYPPRLKIDLTEFPLRSLAFTNRTDLGRTDIVVQRIQDRLRVPQIHLVVKDRTAIVSGTVATGRQRSLAESMLRFEPGIDIVQNEIIIAP